MEERTPRLARFLHDALARLRVRAAERGVEIDGCVAERVERVDVRLAVREALAAAEEQRPLELERRDEVGERVHHLVDHIAEGAQAAGATDGDDYLTIVDRTEAIAAAIDRAAPGDIVLLAGKGHERSIIWGAEKVPWNEAEVARSLLRAQGYARDA